MRLPPDEPWTVQEIEARKDMLTTSFVRLIALYEKAPTDECLGCIVDRIRRFPTLCREPEIATWLQTNRLKLTQRASTMSAATSGTRQAR